MVSGRKIMIVIPVLWLGFVLAISFMEAWLKFQAPGVTREAGLSIGSLVFGVLNKVEIFFSLLLIVAMVRLKNEKHLFFAGLIFVMAILAVQSFFLLPELDRRIQLIINGTTPPESPLHLYYVILEVIKVIGLIVVIHKNLQQIKFR